MARHFAIGLISTAAMAAPGVAAAADDPRLISLGQSGEKSNSDSFDPVVSRDGRYVAFESDANNLDPADTDGTRDVYVRDTVAETTTLVSRADGVDGVDSNGHSIDPSISADGRLVAFASEADNLVPGLPPGRAQVFVRDLAAGTTTLVSRSPGADGIAGPGLSSRPAISADGRVVAFQSTGLFGVDNGQSMSVFVRDLAAQTTSLVSRATGPVGAPANDVSFAPSISADGARVAFTSYGDNLAADHPVRLGSVYLRDLASQRTTLEARASGKSGAAGNSEAGAPEISAGGDRLAFISDSTNLVKGRTGRSSDIYSRDIESARTRILSRHLDVPDGLRQSQTGSLTTSASGERLAFAFLYSREKDGSRPRQYVFLRNVRSGDTRRLEGLSRRWRASIDEFELALSGDGRWLAFQSTKAFGRVDDGDVADIYLMRVGSGKN